MEFTDQMGNIIRLAHYPRRIISLVPSQTELLFDLGLDEEIVGVTEHCVLPADKVASRAKIGAIKRFDFQAIAALNPDLIIGSRDENYRQGILRLQQEYPVWMSNIATLADALDMISRVGQLVNRAANAERLVREITASMAALPDFPPLQAAYLIWKEPFMAAGGGTFINDMLKRCGFRNIFDHHSGYPRIEVDELAEASVILLSTEPFDFSVNDAAFFRGKFPDALVRSVDGRIFSWYGSHMRYGAEYFRRLRASL